jgi:hypothetical protein
MMDDFFFLVLTFYSPFFNVKIYKNMGEKKSQHQPQQHGSILPMFVLKTIATTSLSVLPAPTWATTTACCRVVGMIGT